MNPSGLVKNQTGENKNKVIDEQENKLEANTRIIQNMQISFVLHRTIDF
jgi:hypothetical protein